MDVPQGSDQVLEHCVRAIGQQSAGQGRLDASAGPLGI